MSRRQYQSMDNSSGVGVLDKAALVLGALEAGPQSLAGLVQATGLARPTAHRLAVALEYHRLVARDVQGRFVLGPPLAELAAAAGEDRLLAAAATVLTQLRDLTGESAQLYRRQGDERVCVAAAERLSGLRDTVPIGSVLTMHAGSAAQILLAWEEPDRLHRGPARRGVHRGDVGRRSPPWLGAERRRARARRRLGVRAGAGPQRDGRRRGLHLRPHRAARPAARPAARGRRRRGVERADRCAASGEELNRPVRTFAGQ